MFGFFNRLVSLDLPFAVNGNSISVFAKKDDAIVVAAFLQATQDLPIKLAKDLHLAFTALNNIKTQSLEQEAERLAALNTIRAKYGELMTAFSEAEANEETTDES